MKIDNETMLNIIEAYEFCQTLKVCISGFLKIINCIMGKKYIPTYFYLNLMFYIVSFSE